MGLGAFVVMLAAAVVIVLGLLALLNIPHGNHFTTTVSSNGSVGPAGSLNQTMLDQDMVLWRPSQNSIYPMAFAPNLASIAYDNVYSNSNFGAVMEDYQMLNQTGSNTITIFPGFDAWLLNDSSIIQTYENMSVIVARDNKSLFVQDSSAEYYRSHKQTWAQFTAEWVARDKVLAQTFKPAYFEVIVEPQWYWPFMTNSTEINQSSYGTNATYIANFLNTTPLLNITDWINLTNNLISVVHNVSPNTKIGVSVPAGSLSPPEKNVKYTRNFGTKFLQNETEVNGLYFISFDIYSLGGFNATLNFLNKYGTNGKAVWIAQTWASAGANGQNPCSTQDSEFLLIDYYFALKIHAEGISPFFTNCFVSYSPEPQQSSAPISYYQGREPSFYEFQRIVASNKAGQLLNTT